MDICRNVELDVVVRIEKVGEILGQSLRLFDWPREFKLHSKASIPAIQKVYPEIRRAS